MLHGTICSHHCCDIVSNGCKSSVGAAGKVSPNWSQETMTCHSSNCFSIVWGQGNAPLVISLLSSCNIVLTLKHCIRIALKTSHHITTSLYHSCRRRKRKGWGKDCNRDPRKKHQSTTGMAEENSGQGRSGITSGQSWWIRRGWCLLFRRRLIHRGLQTRRWKTISLWRDTTGRSRRLRFFRLRFTKKCYVFFFFCFGTSTVINWFWGAVSPTSFQQVSPFEIVMTSLS